MPDPEVKIKFTSEYDDAAAKEALLDFENLPIQAGGLVEVINQNYAVLEQMAEALRQTTAGLREHVAALDPAAEGYDRAVANCRSYIERQVALSQQCEAVRNSIMEQAGTVLDLSKALEKGRMSEAQFEAELEGLSQEGIKAEQTIERLAARLDAMNASQKAANLNTKAPEAGNAAAAKAAAEAAKAAAEKSAAAAEKEAQKREALKRVMELETKTRQELAQEIVRLTAAMRTCKLCFTARSSGSLHLSADARGVRITRKTAEGTVYNTRSKSGTTYRRTTLRKHSCAGKFGATRAIKHGCMCGIIATLLSSNVKWKKVADTQVRQKRSFSPR